MLGKDWHGCGSGSGTLLLLLWLIAASVNGAYYLGITLAPRGCQPKIGVCGAVCSRKRILCPSLIAELALCTMRPHYSGALCNGKVHLKSSEWDGREERGANSERKIRSHSAQASPMTLLKCESHHIFGQLLSLPPYTEPALCFGTIAHRTFFRGNP